MHGCVVENNDGVALAAGEAAKHGGEALGDPFDEALGVDTAFDCLARVDDEAIDVCRGEQ